MADELPTIEDLREPPPVDPEVLDTPAALQETGLPPGVERTATGELVRRIPRVAEDGTEWVEVRSVALTMDEARADRKDFYDPGRGWIREGRKPERDRSPQDRLAEGRTATPNPEILKEIAKSGS